MTTDLKDILFDLREDHRNMSILLDLVEEQLLLIDKGEEPDLELFNDVMQYMTIYSDAIHHPKEDLVYARLGEAGDEYAKGLEHVEPEHLSIAAKGGSLRDDIEAMIAGTAVTRDRVMRDTIDYVRLLRRHMLWEEQDLFPRADALAEREATVVKLGDLDRTDPLFGATTPDAFQNLQHHLGLATRD